jgi:uroporphyrinogen-III synthase
VMALRPLEGFVIGVTADRRSAEQAELLERRGASVVHGPTIRTMYLASDEDLRSATEAVIDRPPDYLVATTGIGVRAWFETAASWGLGDQLLASLGPAKAVARGPKAGAALQAAGLSVWARSLTEQLDGLVEIMVGEDLEGRRVVIQEDGVPRPELEDLLAGLGASVVRVPVYRWRLPEDQTLARRLVDAAVDGSVDAITFTSAPAVHNLFAIARAAGVDEDLRRACNNGVVATCVGPVCAEGARAEGITAPIAPDLGRLGLMIRALSNHFEGQRRTYRREERELTVQGALVVSGEDRALLTPKERMVFEFLAAAPPGAVVSRAALLEQGWGSAATDPHVLEVTVGRLRRRLGLFGAAVAAVPGRGYRLDISGPPA